MSGSDAKESALVPVGEALDGLMIQAIPDGRPATGMFAIIQMIDDDGSIGWSVRVTDGLNDEEVLGLLAGYLEHLKLLAAASWQDS
jgi:hypothetical protein